MQLQLGYRITYHLNGLVRGPGTIRLPILHHGLGLRHGELPVLQETRLLGSMKSSPFFSVSFFKNYFCSGEKSRLITVQWNAAPMRLRWWCCYIPIQPGTTQRGKTRVQERLAGLFYLIRGNNSAGLDQWPGFIRGYTETRHELTETKTQKNREKDRTREKEKQRKREREREKSAEEIEEKKEKTKKSPSTSEIKIKKKTQTQSCLFLLRLRPPKKTHNSTLNSQGSGRPETVG